MEEARGRARRREESWKDVDGREREGEDEAYPPPPSGIRRGEGNSFNFYRVYHSVAYVISYIPDKR